MKQQRTLTELAQEIERQTAAAQDYVAPGNDLAFTDDGHLLIGDGGATFDGALTSDAHGQLADRMGIPRRYYDRMKAEQPRLLAENVNTWLGADPAKRTMIRTLDGNARAILSDRYRRIDNLQILSAALPVIMDSNAGIQVASSAVTDRNLYLQCVFPRIEGEVKRGDVVQAGFVMRNSEIGFGALAIEPLIYRLVCTNGMIAPSDFASGRIRKAHLGRAIETDENFSIYADDTREADDRALMLKIRDSIKALSDPDQFLRLVEAMRAATTGETIEKPIAAVEVLAKSFNLSEPESEGILTRLIRNQDYSRYGALNAITGEANETGSYERAIELETAGGKLLTLSDSDWRSIAKAA